MSPRWIDWRQVIQRPGSFGAGTFIASALVLSPWNDALAEQVGQWPAAPVITASGTSGFAPTTEVVVESTTHDGVYKAPNYLGVEITGVMPKKPR